MYPSVTKVVARKDFMLALTFDNGEQGTLDMKPYLDFGVFRKLREPGEFRQVRVAFDTVEWNAGIDLDPEFIHAKCQRLQREPQPMPAEVAEPEG